MLLTPNLERTFYNQSSIEYIVMSERWHVV